MPVGERGQLGLRLTRIGLTVAAGVAVLGVSAFLNVLAYTVGYSKGYDLWFRNTSVVATLHQSLLDEGGDLQKARVKIDP